MKPLSKVIISNGANDVCLLDLVTDLGGHKPTVLIGARNIHGHIKRTKGVKSFQSPKIGSVVSNLGLGKHSRKAV